MAGNELARKPPEHGKVCWRTSINGCDVEDEALHLFRRKLADWADWLEGDDDHAVSPQVELMTDSYITYRLINESRRLAQISD